MNLRSWLRKSPTPVSVRITPYDGDPSTFVIDQADPRKWARAVESIEAMGPRKLEALDRKQQVVRAILIESEEGEEDKPEDPKPLTQSRLGELAMHLNVATNQGAMHVRESVKEAMGAMVTVTQIATNSLEKAANSIERLSKRLEAVSGKTEEDGEQDVGKMLMEGLMMKQLGMGGMMGMLGTGESKPRMAIPTGGEGGEAIEPTPEEEQEIGQFFLQLMQRRMKRDAEAKKPKTEANGAAKPEGK